MTALNQAANPYVVRGVGERLNGDLALMGEVAAQMTWIGSEFDRAAMLADCCAPALGSPQLAAMLSAFASNWSIRRRRLQADLRDQADRAQALGALEDAV